MIVPFGLNYLERRPPEDQLPWPFEIGRYRVDWPGLDAWRGELRWAGLGRVAGQPRLGRARRRQMRLMARRSSNHERPVKTTASIARTPICQLAVVVPRISRSSSSRMPLVTGMT